MSIVSDIVSAVDEYRQRLTDQHMIPMSSGSLSIGWKSTERVYERLKMAVQLTISGIAKIAKDK